MTDATAAMPLSAQKAREVLGRFRAHLSGTVTDLPGRGHGAIRIGSCPDTNTQSPWRSAGT
jgi:hypothetical protein